MEILQQIFNLIVFLFCGYMGLIWQSDTFPNFLCKIILLLIGVFGFVITLYSFGFIISIM